jgi:hypothetical protein
LPSKPEEIGNHQNPQSGDDQEKGKAQDQIPFQDGERTEITDPYLQGNTKNDREAEEDGIFQEQLRPQRKYSR